MSLSADRTSEEESFLEMRDRYAKGEISLAQAVDSKYAKLGMENNQGAFAKIQESMIRLNESGKTASQFVEDLVVNHPPHYNNSDAKCSCGRRIECIDVTRHLSFNIGNAMKYLWRCELKGRTLEDLKKAAWYIQDEINKRSA